MSVQHDNEAGSVRGILLFVVLLGIFSMALTSPTICRFPGRSQGSSEIKIMEVALVMIISDTGIKSLHELFDSEELNRVLGFDPTPTATMTREQFELAERVYTRAIYALLKYGRSANERTERIASLEVDFRAILNEAKINRLGTSYFSELDKDPWGQSFRIWPGPWPETADAPPIPFRVYRPKRTAEMASTPEILDPWVVNVTGKQQIRSPQHGTYEPFGFPAPKDKFAYIYSTGVDRTSGQAIFGGPLTPTNYAPKVASYWGGGDDVNNWDPGQSWKVFY